MPDRGMTLWREGKALVSDLVIIITSPPLIPLLIGNVLFCRKRCPRRNTTIIDETISQRLHTIRLRWYIISHSFLTPPQFATLLHYKRLGYFLRSTRSFTCQPISHVCGLFLDKDGKLRCFTCNLWSVACSLRSVTFATRDFNFDQLAFATSTAVLGWVYTATVSLDDSLAVWSGASLETFCTTIMTL